MAVQAQGWERRLIDLAYEALEGQIAAALHFTNDDRALAAAYKTCEQLTKSHSRTFHMASGFLARDKRRGAGRSTRSAVCVTTSSMCAPKGATRAPIWPAGETSCWTRTRPAAIR